MRLVVGPAFWIVVFSSIVVAMVARNVLVAGRRPLGWALAAVVAAAALEPLVELGQRWVRRWVALIFVLVPLLALGALITWGVVGDLDAQVRQIQRDIPAVATDFEEDERLGDAAKELGLADEAEDLARSLRQPSSRVGEELRGGAATWFLTLILTVFMLAWGPRFASAATDQITDVERRDKAVRVLSSAFERSQRYVDVAVALAVASGLISYATFRIVDLPAPTPLALVVGVGSLVPGLGLVVAAIPAVALAGGLVSPGAGIAVGVGAIVLQVAHHLLLTRATRGAAHPGAAAIVVSFVLGFEVYGVGGAVVGVAVAVFAVAVIDALAAEAERTEGGPAAAEEHDEAVTAAGSDDATAVLDGP